MPIFERRSVMPAPAEEVFAYHARPGAFGRLVPPWSRVRLLDESGDLSGGSIVFDVRVGPVRRRWVGETGSALPGAQFVDRQVEGPFASWEHVHRFVPVDAGHVPRVGQDVVEPLTAPPTLDAGRPSVYLFLPERAAELAFVQQALPGGRVLEFHDPAGQLRFIAYEPGG